MGAAALVAGLAFVTAATASTAWQIGDVFAGVAGGQYNVYSSSGVFKETISDGVGGFTTGCSFNPALDKLYTTNFTASDVVVYNDASPHSIAQTISTGKIAAESIVFAGNGHFFVGGPSDPEIEEYDASGALVDNDTVSGAGGGGTGGPDWIDLSANQATMFYTTEGRIVKRFDVVADVQLADFATLPGSGNAFALRLLAPGDGSGGLLVADRSNIKRIDGSGAVAGTYDVSGEDTWFALNLDPNGTSFWAGDFGTNNFYRFNIASGAVEVGPINTGAGTTLFGLCLKGEITAAVGNIVLTPPTAQNEAGTSHTVTAAVTSSGNAAPGELVTFSVTAGPNTGATGVCSANSDCTTDANGQVSWMYTSNGTVGTDTIQACFDDNGTTKCANASKEWIGTNDPPSVDAGGDVSGDEGSAIALDGSVSDPDGDTVTTTWTYSVVSADAGATCQFADASAVDTTITCTDDGTYSATLTGNDGSNPPVPDSTTVTVSNAAPTVDITAPADGSLYQVGTPVNVSASFDDAGENDTHTCSIDWGDGNSTTGAVVEANGSGTCTGSHSYTSAGVYAITVTVTDDDGDSGSDAVMVVVFDPSGGFVTGGGWIDSPAGAYPADPTLTGKATFGFVSKYKKGATVPDGNTEFQFHAGDLSFHSAAYQWLVVNANGCRAQFKGTGTINGAGSYGFMLWAYDGNCGAAPGPDKFRIKIWNGSNESAVVYDNGVAYPTGQPLGSGSIVVHTPKK